MSQPALSLDRPTRAWLLAVALVTTLPHTAHQPLWLSALAGLLLVSAGWLWLRQGPLPGRWLLSLLALTGGAAVFAEYHTLLGRDAGVSLLVIFMAMKLLELNSRRDASVLITLGYFLLLTHYFYSQSMATGLWLLVALWLITAALIRLHGGPPATPRHCLRLAAGLLTQALPFLLVLYLLFPRLGGPLWGLPQDAQRGQSGLAAQMTPGSIAELALSDAIAFRVRFDTTPPPRQQRYWRGPVMEIFDGTTWRPSQARRQAEQIVALSPPITYQTTLEAHHQAWLLALDAPTELPPESSLNGTLTVLARQAVGERRQFRLASSLDYRLNIEEQPDVLRRNLQLPADRLPRTRQLAAAWQASGAPPEAIVQRALDLFASPDFAYTLRPPLLGRDGIDDFLFTTRRGFCEHYAAAFVVLMRAAGIPARVVGGYQGGEINPVDGYLIVRQADAHAWSEVWLAGRGWVRVDPTAVVAPLRLEAGLDTVPGAIPPSRLGTLPAAWLRELRQHWEAVNNAWNQQVLGYDSQGQRQLLDRLGLPAADWPKIAALLGLSCTLLLAGLTAWTLYQRPRREPANRLWQRALRNLARSAVHCAPWETPNTLLRRVQAERPALAPAFSQVVAAYLAARYARQPGDLKTLRDAVARLP